MNRLLEFQEVVDKIKQHPHDKINIAIWEYENNKAYAKVGVSNDFSRLGNTFYIDYIEFNLEEDDVRDHVKELQRFKARLKTRFKESVVTSDLRW